MLDGDNQIIMTPELQIKIEIQMIFDITIAILKVSSLKESKFSSEPGNAHTILWTSKSESLLASVTSGLTVIFL